MRRECCRLALPQVPTVHSTITLWIIWIKLPKNTDRPLETIGPCDHSALDSREEMRCSLYLRRNRRPRFAAASACATRRREETTPPATARKTLPANRDSAKLECSGGVVFYSRLQRQWREEERTMRSSLSTELELELELDEEEEEEVVFDKYVSVRSRWRRHLLEEKWIFLFLFCCCVFFFCGCNFKAEIIPNPSTLGELRIFPPPPNFQSITRYPNFYFVITVKPSIAMHVFIFIYFLKEVFPFILNCCKHTYIHT